MTGDPDLHLLLDGQRLDPVSVEKPAYRFALPALAGAPRRQSLRLCSRSNVPAYIGRQRDHRRLGVAFSRLEFRGRGVELAIDSDSPLFERGAHRPERGFRWTDGDLELPASLLAAFPEGLELTVHTVHVMTYPAPEAACATQGASASAIGFCA